LTSVGHRQSQARLPTLNSRLPTASAAFFAFRTEAPAFMIWLRDKDAPMSVAIMPGEALRLLHDVASAMVRDDQEQNRPDFTLRQIVILLTVYLEPPPHTVRGLAGKLGVTKPVITRALNAMGKHLLLTRRRDERDRRNVIVQGTASGEFYVQRLGGMVVARAAALPAA
jgi:DNA-binding MarR family transcriptional regulator